MGLGVGGLGWGEGSGWGEGGWGWGTRLVGAAQLGELVGLEAAGGRLGVRSVQPATVD